MKFFLSNNYFILIWRSWSFVTRGIISDLNKANRWALSSPYQGAIGPGDPFMWLQMTFLYTSAPCGCSVLLNKILFYSLQQTWACLLLVCQSFNNKSPLLKIHAIFCNVSLIQIMFFHFELRSWSHYKLTLVSH